MPDPNWKPPRERGGEPMPPWLQRLVTHAKYKRKVRLRDRRVVTLIHVTIPVEYRRITVVKEKYKGRTGRVLCSDGPSRFSVRWQDVVELIDEVPDAMVDPDPAGVDSRVDGGHGDDDAREACG